MPRVCTEETFGSDHIWISAAKSSLYWAGIESMFWKKSSGWSSTAFFLVAHLVSGNHHTPGIPGGWQSWPLLKHINGQIGSCEGSWTALWWSSLVSCPKQINSSNFIHGKANISLHCQERNAACISPPKFLRQLCHHFKDIAQNPQDLFACHCHHPRHWVPGSHQTVYARGAALESLV